MNSISVSGIPVLVAVFIIIQFVQLISGSLKVKKTNSYRQHESDNDRYIHRLKSKGFTVSKVTSNREVWGDARKIQNGVRICKIPKTFCLSKQSAMHSRKPISANTEYSP